MLLLFIMPSLKSGPHHLEVGIVGSEQTITDIDKALKAQDPEAFDLREYPSAESLNNAIETREITAGFDLSQPDTLRIAVASAGSTAVSGTLTQTGQAIGKQMSLEPKVDDIVALPEADPTGTGIGGLAFPLVFGGIVPAVAFRSLLTGHRSWILGGIVLFSLVGGFIVALVLQELFGSIEGVLWPVTGAMALGIAALALPLSGLAECFGNKGFTVAAMTMMFVGNPFAGIATSAVWLPTAVATLGQLLPPRSDGYPRTRRRLLRWPRWHPRLLDTHRMDSVRPHPLGPRTAAFPPLREANRQICRGSRLEQALLASSMNEEVQHGGQ